MYCRTFDCGIVREIAAKIRAFYSLLHRILPPYGKEKMHTEIDRCMSHLVITAKVDKVDDYTDISKITEILIGIAQSILFASHIEEPNGESYSDSVFMAQYLTERPYSTFYYEFHFIDSQSLFFSGMQNIFC